MAYDETEDPEELLKYYDFGLSNEDLAEPNAGNNTVAMDTDELVLQNGLRVGHRKFLKQYKQQHHPRKEQAREVQRAHGFCIGLIINDSCPTLSRKISQARRNWRRFGGENEDRDLRLRMVASSSSS